METYSQHIELINNYLNNLLSKEARLDFESKLQNDIEFNALYEEHFIFVNGLKRVQIKTEIQKAKQSYHIEKWLKISGISIIVIGALVMLYSLVFNTSEKKSTSNNDNFKTIIETTSVEKSISEIIIDSSEVNDAETESDVETHLNQTLSKEKHRGEAKETHEIKILDSIEEIVEMEKPESLSQELIAFYESVKKSPEIIEINNEKDITITCKEGTKLTIPAKSFIDLKTGKIARGTISIEVTEYYKLSDMLLANLTTKCDDEVLETGGMLYLSANKNGSKLELSNPIQIEFNNRGKEQMQLFSGELKENNVNWKLDKQNEMVFARTKGDSKENSIAEDEISYELIDESIQVPIKYVEEVPILPGCENGTQVEKRKCLEDYLNSLMEKNFNKSIAEDLDLAGKHKIKVVFKINKEGSVSDIEAFASHTKLAQEAVRVVELIPQMQPAKQRGITVSVPYALSKHFNVGKSTKNNPSSINVKAKTTFQENFEEKLKIRDSVFIAVNNRQSNESQNSTALFGTVSSNDLSRYVFSSTQLGWINCDRFVRAKNTFKFKVKIKDAEGSNIKMIFKSLSSILQSKSFKNEFDFGIIPAKEEVSLVAIKETDGRLFLAIKDIKTGFNPNVDLEFNEVNIEEIKKELEKLNKTFN